MFYDTGCIRVRIGEYQLTPTVDMVDMQHDPKRSVEEFGNASEIYGNTDTYAYLYTPYGGGADQGFFTLPQPNTRGIVAKLGTTYSADENPVFVYLGGLSKFNEITKSIKMPSDDLNTFNGKNNDNINIQDPFNTLIFKQKQTFISRDSNGKPSDEVTDDSKNSLDWSKRPTQNMVVLNREQVNISHNIYNKDEELSGQAKFTFDSNGINISFLDTDSNNESKVYLDTKGNFEISNINSKDEITNKLSATTSEINLYHNDRNCEASIFMGKNYAGKNALITSIKSRGKSVPSEISISDDGIDITSSGNISINPGSRGTVSLGSGNGYVLTSLSPGSIEIGNVTLVASKNVTA